MTKIPKQKDTNFEAKIFTYSFKKALCLQVDKVYENISSKWNPQEFSGDMTWSFSDFISTHEIPVFWLFQDFHPTERKTTRLI